MVMRLIDQTDAPSCSNGEDIARSRQAVRASATAQTHPDGVPGSDRQPQPALYGGHVRSPTPACAWATIKGRNAVRGAARTLPPRRPATTCSTLPHQLSGARRRRVDARAIALRIPTRHSRRATATLGCRSRPWCSNLLQDSKVPRMSYLFVSHDLKCAAPVRRGVVSRRAGSWWSRADRRSVARQRSYTRELLTAIPQSSFHA